MIDFIATSKMTDRQVVASSCLLGFRLGGTGLSGVSLGANERPAKAPAVVEAAAQAHAYAFDIAVAGAGAGRQKTQIQTQTQHQHHMWAFRGLYPWRDPA